MQGMRTRPSRHITTAIAVLGLAQSLLAQTAAAAPMLYKAIVLSELAETSEMNEKKEIAGSMDLVPDGDFYSRRAALFSRPTGFPDLEYFAEDLGTLGIGSQGLGINNHGQVVGVNIYDDLDPFDFIKHAFIYSDGVMTDIHPLLGNARDSWAEDINDAGHVTGHYRALGMSGERAFLYANRVMITDLGYFNDEDPHTEAHAINNAGQVVGLSWISLQTPSAFLYDRATGIVNIGPTGRQSHAKGISDTGFITGGVQTERRFEFHAFLYKVGDDTGMIDLGTLKGDLESVGLDVNNAGQVVGYSDVKAFIYTDGGMRDLNKLIDPEHPLPAGMKLSVATDINEQGCITANGYLNDESPPTFAILLCPTRPLTALSEKP